VITNACMTTYMHDGVHRPPSQLTSSSVSYETVLYDQSKHFSAIKIANYAVPHLPKLANYVVKCGGIYEIVQYICSGFNGIVP
jgi:hypothetical protein